MAFPSKVSCSMRYDRRYVQLKSYKIDVFILDRRNRGVKGLLQQGIRHFEAYLEDFCGSTCEVSNFKFDTVAFIRG